MSFPTPDDMSDRDFILSNALWPNRTTLPLKMPNPKPGGFPRLGYLRHESREDGWTVYRSGTTDPEVEYETLDDLLDAGWIVD